VSNDLGGRFASSPGNVGLFGFVDVTTPDDRILAVYDDECEELGEYYVSINPSGHTGLKLINDNGILFILFVSVNISLNTLT
jgi:type 1 glutamine amidotransferase